jgi:para-aminobenzoate synthetase component 1
MAYYILKSYKLNFEPIEIFEALRHEKNCFFLDSSLNSNHQGRYSFLGIDPLCILQTKNQNPFPKLRDLLDKYKVSASGNIPPFLGGAVGYLAYDLGFLLERKLQKKTKDDLAIPDCFFGFYNTVIITDNIKKILYIAALGLPEKKNHLAKALAQENFKKIRSLLSKAGTCKIKTWSCAVSSQLKSNFSRKEYLSAVNAAKRYIKEGDIYQVNLSQRFQTETKLSSLEIYQRLRKISPSYFSAYFDAGDFQILSSSPERFLRLEGGRVITRPMKGTRPRGKTVSDDVSLRRDLLNSQKDKAELVMIVDLERNDLGRVCDYDSIKVTRLRELEKYNTVYQTTSTIEGELFKDKDRVDLLAASFPGGSITGCPKIRAMEIIEELEPTRRSIYTGALGYLSFTGNMDFNILIRTILKKENNLYFSVGGGIVADSNPEAEYEETLVKARAMLQAIGTPFLPKLRVSPKGDTLPIS